MKIAMLKSLAEQKKIEAERKEQFKANDISVAAMWQKQGMEDLDRENANSE